MKAKEIGPKIDAALKGFQPVPKMRRDKRICIYATDTMHAEVKRTAARHHMSITDYVEAILSKALGVN
jgi:hypothetical protein